MQPQRVPAPLELRPVPESSSRARRFVREGLAAWRLDSLTDAAELGVSEMVTNACLHARTAIVVALRMVSPGVVRIEVSDESPLLPQQRVSGRSLTTTGRGLLLLSSYGVWGIDAIVGGGKTVWFEPSDGQLESSFGPGSLEDWPSL